MKSFHVQPRPIHLRDHRPLIRERKRWSKPEVIRGIHSLRDAGHALGYRSLTRDSGTHNLVHAGKKLFGSWDRALRASGMDPTSVRLRPFIWNRWIVVRAIKALYGNGVSLAEIHVRRNQTMKSKKIIFDAIGHHLTGRQLYLLARWKFGSWNYALDYVRTVSGLGSSWKCRKGIRKIKDQTTFLLQKLHRQGFALNSSAVQKNSRLIQAYNRGKLNTEISGANLLTTAIRCFGSWDEALKAAQLNPLEIRLRARSRTSDLPLIPHQVERTRDSKVRLLGEPPKSPEEMLEETGLQKVCGSDG